MHTQTHACNTIQLHAYIHIRNTQILSQILTFNHEHIHTYNYIHVYNRAAYFLFFKNTQTYSSAH